MNTIDLIHNYPYPTNSIKEMLESLSERIHFNVNEAISFIPQEGIKAHREIAGKWMNIPENRVAFGVSGHQIFTAIVLGFSQFGDKIGCDEITYNGWLNVMNHTGRKNTVVRGDEHGMLPEALDEVAKKEKLWGIYLMPSLHNPYCTVMPLERKKALVEICRKHDLWVIDDDAYRFLNPEPTASFAHLYPEKSFWLQSLTKPLFPSVKTSLLAFPEKEFSKVTEAIRITAHQASSLTLPWVLELLANGKLDKLTAEKRIETKRRQDIAAEILRGHEYRTYPTSCHLWLTVPEDWKCPDVSIVPGKLYQAGPPTRLGIRVAITGESDDRLREGLRRLVSSL